LTHVTALYATVRLSLIFYISVALFVNNNNCK